MSDLLIIGAIGLLLGMALASLALLRVSPDLDARWPWLDRVAGIVALFTGGALAGLGLARKLTQGSDGATQGSAGTTQGLPTQIQGSDHPPKTLEEETHPDADAIPVYPLPPREAPEPPAVDDLDAWAADYVAGAGEDGVLEADDEEMP